MLGSDLEPITPESVLAIKAWNLLSNGSGGIDWAGLEFVCALLGVEDVEALTYALLTIKGHKPDKEEHGPSDSEH